MSKKSKFKQTEIGIIPEDWEIYTINDVSEVVGGTTPSTKEVTNFGGDIAWLTPKDLSNYKYRYIDKGERNITETGLKSKGIKKLPKGAVLLTTRAPIGYVAIAKNEITTNQGFRSLIPNKKAISEYLYYLLKNNTERLISNSSGTTFGELSGGTLRKMNFAFPPVDEQRSIAKILSDLDAKIELNQKMNSALEAVGQALFKRWFVDFDFPNEKSKPYKSSGGTMIDSELGEIPKGWRVRTVSDCGRVVCGKTPPTKDKENYGEDFPFITIPDMHQKTFIINTERKISRLGAGTQLKKELPALSICVSCIATPGIVAMTTEKSHTNQQINSIVCYENIGPYFVYLTMKSKSEEIKSKGLGGTATLNLNTGNFGKIKLILPSAEILQVFQNEVDEIFSRILLNDKEIDLITKIRDYLLPKVMSGRIRVPIEARG